MKNLTIASMIMAAPLLAAAQSLPLEVKYAPDDTVTAEKVNIVAVTTPGATATINGSAAHVYSTGSFGMPVSLQPGANTITVAVSKDGDQTEKTLRVYRAEPRAKGAQKAAQEDMMFASPFTVTSLPGAFLVYGNGDDRLGGSKMGFIAEDIPLKVTGENGDLYRVQLSACRHAYIEKGYVTRTDAAASLAPVNTGSWSVANQGTADRVTVSLPRRLPYRSYTLLDPNTICIELFGAMDNSNWITQHGPLVAIDYVYFEQPESDVYRIVIRLKQACWGYSIGYNQRGALTVDVRHTPRSLHLRNLAIGLDAGHGGTSSGAVSPSGIKESDVNLDIILRLKALLEKAGAKVVMTRTDDSSLTMAERKRIWKEGGVDLAISVHNNAGGSPFEPMGTSVYYKHLFDRPLAVCMHRRMLELGVADYGLTGNFNFSLNGPTDYPNVLIEGLFMSSLAEEEMLADPDVRQKIAAKILEGLKDYLRQVGS